MLEGGLVVDKFLEKERRFAVGIGSPAPSSPWVYVAAEEMPVRDKKGFEVLRGETLTQLADLTDEGNEVRFILNIPDYISNKMLVVHL